MSTEKIHTEGTEPTRDDGFTGGKRVDHVLTTASEQNPDVAPVIPFKAILVALNAAVYWIIQLYVITVLAAYSRNIVAALGGQDKQPWVLNAFNVVTIVAAPILSYFADAYGRKWFIIAPLLLGVVGGAVASRAQSMSVVVVGTTFLGFAGSPLGITTAVPSEVLPHRYRSGVQAVVFFCSAFGAIAGLTGISKAIANDPINGWRVMFYVMIGAYLVQASLWFLTYHPPPRTHNQLTESRHKLDIVGYVFLAAASTLFLMGLSWGGVVHPWKSAHVLGTLIPGVVLYILFGIWEWKGTSEGILHHGLFGNRNFPLVIVAIAIEGYVYLGFTSLYPGQVATVYEHDIFKAGQLSLPFYGAFLIALAIGGTVASATRDTVTPIIVGYIVFTGALFGFVFSTPESKGLFVAMDVLAGLGFSQPLMLLTVVSQFSTPPALIALSTAIVLSTRALGGAVGVAVSTTIVNSKVGEKLPAYIARATLPLGLNPQLLGPVIGAAAGDAQLIEAIMEGKIPGVTPRIFGAAAAAAEQAFSDSYKWAWVALIPFSFIGTLSIFSLRRNRKQLDYIIDEPIAHVHHKGSSHV